jgi:hypothetical protein
MEIAVNDDFEDDSYEEETENDNFISKVRHWLARVIQSVIIVFFFINLFFSILCHIHSFPYPLKEYMQRLNMVHCGHRYLYLCRFLCLFEQPIQYTDKCDEFNLYIR